MSDELFGCIEAGGTKFVAGVLRRDRTILRTERIATGEPGPTLAATLRFFEEARAEWGGFDAVGIASFGPVAVDRASPDWGRILPTPKPGWSGTDLVTPFAEAFNCPAGLDTDVGAAILAEHEWGAARGAGVATYVTVGTGIGGGLLVDGRVVHGTRHPEMGHMLPRRHPDDRDYAGSCPFHGDCLEGLASGPAIAARWGASLSSLAPDHVAHGIVAFYLAQLVVAQRALLSPERMVFGGGVMATPGLLDRVRTEVRTMEAGYFGNHPPETLVVPPGLGTEAGLMGALALALDAGRR